MKAPAVRGLDARDWAWILALNAVNEAETSPLEEAKLAHMSREACLTLACGEEAFLIAFDQDSDYASPNFLWFRERYRRFVYVDRVVVAERARGRGLGRALYEHVMSEADAPPPYERIVCEVNIDPPNPVSDRFHAKLGFSEVGQARLENGKMVRYLLRELS